MNRRTFAVLVAAATVVAIGSTAALATWSGNGKGAATSTAVTMPVGSTPTAPITTATSTATINVKWPAVNYTGGAVSGAGYVVTRYKGAAVDNVAGDCTGTVVALQCNDSLTSNGTYSYTVKPKSGAWVGTEGPKSGTVTYTAPVAPAAPSAPVLDATTDSGTLGDNTTNFTLPKYTGTAVAGSTVNLYSDGGATPVGSGTATGGNYAVTLTTALAQGSHTITAKATVAAVQSVASTGTPVLIDTTAPTGVAVTNSPSGRGPTVSGTAGTAAGDTASVTVTITCTKTANGAVSTNTATTSVTSGTWTVTLPGNTLTNNATCSATATQTDTAGNSKTSAASGAWST
jgi:hypothetical protein